MSVVPIGINVKGFEKRESSRDNVFRVGYFARVAPEKGLHLLADAFVLLKKQLKGQTGAARSGRLHGCGSGSRYFASIQRTLEASRRRRRLLVPRHGRPRREARIPERARRALGPGHLLTNRRDSSCSRRWRAACPSMQPRRGSFTEIVETTGGGLLVKPDDAASLADGLLELYRDVKKRAELGRRGSEGVRQHYACSAPRIA